MFLSTKRAIWSAIIALGFDFYAFNFIPRNINIIATRSAGRQVFDYILNFVIFFIVMYLAVTFITYIIGFFVPKNKK